MIMMLKDRSGFSPGLFESGLYFYFGQSSCSCWRVCVVHMFVLDTNSPPVIARARFCRVEIIILDLSDSFSNVKKGTTHSLSVLSRFLYLRISIFLNLKGIVMYLRISIFLNLKGVVMYLYFNLLDVFIG